MPKPIAIFVLSFLASVSLAQTEQAPASCTDQVGFSDFDFWVGEWKVYSNDDKRLFFGDNSITKHHGDCLLMENWRSAGGGGGFSVNYFNPVTREWRQVWVSNGYSIDYTGGLNDAGVMVLTGLIYDYSKKQPSEFRGSWTPVDAEQVIQKFEIFDSESKSWKLWFEGLYVRQR
jgi:hypothetical protein